MSAERFEELVAEALDGIPPELGSKMDNVAVFVEDRGRQANLLGLYHGVPLTSRDAGYAGMVMPDRITIYRLPICAMSATEAEVVRQVRVTVVHEVAPPLRHRRQPLGRARLGVKSGLVGYPTRLLNDGEEIILDLKPHWMYLVPTVIVWLGATLASAVIWSVSGQSWMGWVTLIVFLGLGVNAAVRWSKWVTTSFTVTNDRIIFRQGIVSKRGIEIPLDRINNIDFHQRIWERVIGAGDLDIESAGKDGQSHFENVRHPDLVQQEIYRQMEVKPARRAAAAPARAPPQPCAPPPPPADRSRAASAPATSPTRSPSSTTLRTRARSRPRSSRRRRPSCSTGCSGAP